MRYEIRRATAFRTVILSVIFATNRLLSAQSELPGTTSSDPRIRPFFESTSLNPSPAMPERLAKNTRHNGAPTLRRTSQFPDPGPEVLWGTGDRYEFGSFPRDSLEAIIDSPNFLPAYFFEEGKARQRAVGRITLKQDFGTLHRGDGYATGFLISKNGLLMTNHHVIKTKDCARKLRVIFDYQYTPDGEMMTPIHYEFAPDDAFYTNPDLDFTLIQIKPTDPAENRELGFISIATPAKYVKEVVTIIVQHPLGRAIER